MNLSLGLRLPLFVLTCALPAAALLAGPLEDVAAEVYLLGEIHDNPAHHRVQAEAVADYQQAVLVALREVEDALGDLGALRREIGAQEEAVRSAQRAVALSTKRYEEGLVRSIEVVDAVREQLTAERRAVQVRAQQHEATVRLIQALGGGVRATDVSR